MYMKRSILALMGLAMLAGVGAAQAEADKRAIPATEHQEEALALSEQVSDPYEFTKIEDQTKPVMPATQHQAEVLGIDRTT